MIIVQIYTLQTQTKYNQTNQLLVLGVAMTWLCGELISQGAGDINNGVTPRRQTQ